MDVPEEPPWETCEEPGCIGVQLDDVKRCWAHATEPDVEAALTQLAADGRLDGRGVRFTEDLLLRVLGAVPRDEVGALRFHKV